MLLVVWMLLKAIETHDDMAVHAYPRAVTCHDQPRARCTRVPVSAVDYYLETKSNIDMRCHMPLISVAEF